MAKTNNSSPLTRARAKTDDTSPVTRSMAKEKIAAARQMKAATKKKIHSAKKQGKSMQVIAPSPKTAANRSKLSRNRSKSWSDKIIVVHPNTGAKFVIQLPDTVQDVGASNKIKVIFPSRSSTSEGFPQASTEEFLIQLPIRFKATMDSSRAVSAVNGSKVSKNHKESWPRKFIVVHPKNEAYFVIQLPDYNMIQDVRAQTFRVIFPCMSSMNGDSQVCTEKYLIQLPY